jgi:NifU-like protein
LNLTFDRPLRHKETRADQRFVTRPIIACNALLDAIREYSNAARDDWAGDEALICTCFFVSERTIESEIQTRGLTTVAEVTKACNAGAGCGSCHQLIQEILETNDLPR